MDPIGEDFFLRAFMVKATLVPWHNIFTLEDVDEDMELWDIINKGLKIRMKKDSNGNDISSSTLSIIKTIWKLCKNS